jgi:hypothetical protein
LEGIKNIPKRKISIRAFGTANSCNDSVTVRINTSNREDFALDGGFDDGSRVTGDPSPSFAYNPMGSAPTAQVNGGTAGYIGATDNIFPSAFIPAVARAAPTAPYVSPRLTTGVSRAIQVSERYMKIYKY